MPMLAHELGHFGLNTSSNASAMFAMSLVGFGFARLAVNPGLVYAGLGVNLANCC
jgi:Zn-dependent protease with chaperone function